MLGNKANMAVPGWLVKEYEQARPDPEKDAEFWNWGLTYSFELEGKSLHIMNLYMPEGAEEDAWLAMPLQERANVIGNNFYKLKQKIQSVALPWMPNYIYEEDMGVLWEVAFSGDSCGYTVDLDYIKDEMHNSVHDLQLSHGQRNDHFQVHVSFSLKHTETSTREQIFALLAHMSDFLFLRNFQNSIVDPLNELWSSNDVDGLMSVATAGSDELLAYVCKSNGGLADDALKLKVIGLRGMDIYRTEERYGFEIRKGYTLVELTHLVTLIQDLFKQIGRSAAEDINVRLNASGGAKPVGYSLAMMTEWVKDTKGGRVVPHLGDKSRHKELGEETSGFTAENEQRIQNVASEWLAQMQNGEIFLSQSKQVVMHGSLERAKSEGALSIALPVHKTERFQKQIRQRLGFLLNANFDHFPNADKRMLHQITQDQASILWQLERIPCVPISDIADAADVQSASFLCEAWRERVTEFAGRISRLY